MIYTLTLNPAIDYVMTTRKLIIEVINRSTEQLYSAAGKGINVSLALKKLGIENIAICLCGEGFVGDWLTKLLQSNNLEHSIIPVIGCDTRINVKVHHGDCITEINGNFTVDEKALVAVHKKLDTLKSGDVLIASGSLPTGVPVDFYADITLRLTKKGIYVIVDTSGEPLKEVVKTGKAFLIKPNQHELGELLNVKIQTLDNAITYAQKLNCNTLTSMGKLGAVLVTANDVHICNTPKVITNGYTVGAGDALLAGFIADYISNKDYKKALLSGVDYAMEYIYEK